jgi:putative addiction module CopG family antidote
MTIHLPEDLERFVQAKVQSGRFASEEAAIAEAVRLLRQAEEGNGKEAEPRATAEPTWRRVLKTMEDVPDSVFEGIPADSSEQLDHYVYGSPRRPVQ